MAHTLKILSVLPVTHNVRRIRLQKPEGYSYIPGQATDVIVNKPGWTNEKRPFTFTSLNSDDHLEFTIKSYTDHDGVTNQVAGLVAGDELILDEPWGAIAYKGAGYFIAGGAGITPFIAILRQLHKENKLAGNKLFFSNKTAADIIYEQELKDMLGDNAVFVLSKSDGAHNHIEDRINETFLTNNVADFNAHFYICGPDPMIASVQDLLEAKGAKTDSVVFEK